MEIQFIHSILYCWTCLLLNSLRVKILHASAKKKKNIYIYIKHIFVELCVSTELLIFPNHFTQTSPPQLTATMFDLIRLKTLGSSLILLFPLALLPIRSCWFYLQNTPSSHHSPATSVQALVSFTWIIPRASWLFSLWKSNWSYENIHPDHVILCSKFSKGSPFFSEEPNCPNPPAGSWSAVPGPRGPRVHHSRLHPSAASPTSSLFCEQAR